MSSAHKAHTEITFPKKLIGFSHGKKKVHTGNSFILMFCCSATNIWFEHIVLYYSYSTLISQVKKNTSKSKICQQLIDKFVPKCVTILISLYHTWYSVLCLSVIDLKYNKTKSINDLFSKRALKRWKEAINKTRTYPNHMYYFQNVSSVRIFSVVCKINDDKHLYKVIDIKFVE